MNPSANENISRYFETFFYCASNLSQSLLKLFITSYLSGIESLFFPNTFGKKVGSNLFKIRLASVSANSSPIP